MQTINVEYAIIGIETNVRVDGAAVLKRLRRERDERFVGRNLSYVAKIPAQHKIEGRARFIAPGQLQEAVLSSRPAA